MPVNEKQRQSWVAETPGPSRVAVNAPARLIPLDHGRGPEQVEQFVNYRGEQRAAPTQVTEQAGPADRQAKEIVEQVLGFAQRDT
jgi:hypothetical protein